MPLRAVYTDLDGTMLGPQGNLFAAPDGSFSRRQAQALEACHRAGVEVVIMSGRREAQVMADSRIMGQSSYIYEAGCGVVIEWEKTLLTGEWQPGEQGNPAEQMTAAGIPDLLFDHFEGMLEWHDPWSVDRELSHLYRGKVDVAEANRLLAEAGHAGLRFLDNGSISTRVKGIEIAHAYHLVPEGASKLAAVEFHTRARGYTPEECIAIGDSLEDLDTAAAVARFFCVANGPDRDPGVREALARVPNATVTEGRMGDGFHEAVISTLAE